MMILAAIPLIHLLIVLVIGGLIFWLLWWFIGFIGLPAPFNKVAQVVIALFAVLFLIHILLSLTGHPLFYAEDFSIR